MRLWLRLIFRMLFRLSLFITRHSVCLVSLSWVISFMIPVCQWAAACLAASLNLFHLLFTGSVLLNWVYVLLATSWMILFSLVSQALLKLIMASSSSFSFALAWVYLSKMRKLSTLRPRPNFMAFWLILSPCRCSFPRNNTVISVPSCRRWLGARQQQSRTPSLS